MKNKACLHISCLTTILCLALFACASAPKHTKLNNVWKFENYSKGHIDKVLVVGKTIMEKNRIVFEDYMTRQLKKRTVSVLNEETQQLEKKQIEAFASHTLIPELQDLSRERVIKAAGEINAKTVLATRTMSVDEKNVMRQGKVSYEYYSHQYGNINIAPAPTRSYVGQQTQVFLESGLYDLDSGKLIWAATSKVIDPVSVESAIEDFCNVVFQQLINDGFIR